MVRVSHTTQGMSSSGRDPSRVEALLYMAIYIYIYIKKRKEAECLLCSHGVNEMMSPGI